MMRTTTGGVVTMNVVLGTRDVVTMNVVLGTRDIAATTTRTRSAANWHRDPGDFGRGFIFSLSVLCPPAAFYFLTISALVLRPPHKDRRKNRPDAVDLAVANRWVLIHSGIIGELSAEGFSTSMA
jgi:hypothetical protein